MVALVSPAFGRSPWTAKEVEYALTQPRFEGRVVTLMVRPTRSFPWILEKLSFIRATDDWEETTDRVMAALNPALEPAA